MKLYKDISNYFSVMNKVAPDELFHANFVGEIQDVYQPLTADHILQIRRYVNKDRYGHHGQIKVENVRLDEIRDNSRLVDYVDFITQFYVVDKFYDNPEDEIQVLMQRIGYDI